MIPGERMMQIPTAAPAIIPDEKEAAAAPQDSHSSTIDPDPILHTVQPPAAAPPNLAEETIHDVMDRMQATERDQAKTAESGDDVIMNLLQGMPAEAIAEVSADVEEKNLQEKERKDAVQAFTYGTTGGKVLIDDAKLAGHLHTTFSTVSFNQSIFCYHDGIYRENKGEIESEIAKILKVTKTREQLTRVTREVLAYLEYTDPQRQYPFNQAPGLIPVANGVIRINYDDGNVDLLPHSPEYGFTYQMPITYDANADGTPIRDVFSEYVDPDVVDVLYEIPAVALLQMNGSKPFKRSYLLQGDTNAAKTTYLEIVGRLIGPENVSSVSLHQLTNDRFCFADMEGRILNIYDELKDIPLKDVGVFKALTGGFKQRIERKHANAYDGVIRCVHLFSCNEPPEFPSGVEFDSAWWSRWEYLNFPNSFETDRTFLDRVVTPAALSGFLNDVIKTMVHVQTNGLYRDPDPGRVKDSWKLASDPFAEFLAAEMIPKRDGVSTFDKGGLLTSFRRWCTDQGKNQRKIPESAKTFAPMIFRNQFYSKQIGKEKTWVYAGAYRWKDESKYQNPF